MNRGYMKSIILTRFDAISRQDKVQTAYFRAATIVLKASPSRRLGDAGASEHLGRARRRAHLRLMS
jgi:hypothetical protein